ncbi:MAG: flippase-like domain-containing protein [Bacteroidetes bacterium]|nr:flippase-like domain-containing protein [Bacteroidota bacterium]
MNKRTKSILQFVVLLGLGIFIGWLSLRSVAPKKDEIFKAFRNADYFWVGISMIVSIFGHLLRAYRWNYLLKPLGYKARLINASGGVFIGYFANYGLPRMGELTRCTIAARYDKVPFEVALGTVITERIVDFAVLILVFILTLLAQFTQLIGLANQYIFDPLSLKLQSLANRPVALTVVIVLMLGALIGFLMLRKRMANALRGKFGKIIKGFGEGIGSIRQMEKKGQFILLSLGIWATYFYSMYAAFYAFDGMSAIGQAECLTLLLFGTFGVIFTPGGIGVYQALITQLLLYYKLDDVTAASFPWLTWGSQFVMIVSLGISSLIILPIVNRNKTDVVSQ